MGGRCVCVDTHVSAGVCEGPEQVSCYRLCLWGAPKSLLRRPQACGQWSRLGLALSTFNTPRVFLLNSFRERKARASSGSAVGTGFKTLVQRIPFLSPTQRKSRQALAEPESLLQQTFAVAPGRGRGPGGARTAVAVGAQGRPGRRGVLRGPRRI